MKVVFDRKTLAETLSRVKSFVPSRSPKPILANLHLRAAEEAIFSATNLELSLQTTLRALRCDEGGDCLLRADRFVAIVQSATDTDVALESNDSGVRVTCGRGRWQLDTEPPQDFPLVHPKVNSPHATLGARAFLDAAKLAALSTDANASRYALSGLLVEADGQGTLTLVGTDGRRLTRVRLPVAGGAFSGLVPRAALDRLATGLIDAGEIDLQLDATWFRAETTGCMGLARLVEGRFPKWQDVVKPYAFTEAATLSAAALAEAVQQAAVAATERDGLATVDLTFAEGVLILESRSAGVGHATVDMPIHADAGAVPTPTKFHCQPAYLRDFLKALGDRPLRFCLKGTTGGVADSLALAGGDLAAHEPEVFYVLMGLSTDR